MLEVIPAIKPTQIRATAAMEQLAQIRMHGRSGHHLFIEVNWADHDHAHVQVGNGPRFLVDATTNLMHLFCTVLRPALYTVTEHWLHTGSVIDPSLLLTMQLAELRAFRAVSLDINSR